MISQKRSPGIIRGADRRRVSVGQRKVVEELANVQESVDVVLEGSVSDS